MKTILTMKKTLVAALMLCAGLTAQAQVLAVNTLAAAADTEVKAGRAAKVPEASRAAAPLFVFHTNGDIPVAETAFPEEHYLGGDVSKKWNTFLANYTHEYSVSVGLSNSGYEYIKPAVFNAVNRANKYVKKALKSHSMTKDEAVSKLSHMLDCANVIFYEPDTDKFEAAAKAAKTGADVIRLFDSVKLVK